MTVRRAVLLSLLLLAPVALAQAPAGTTTERLTLAEVLERARVHSARLQSLSALEVAAAESLRGARAGRMPQIDLLASYTRNSNVPELTVPVVGQGLQTIFPNIPDNWRTRAQASLPLYTGGRVSGQVDAALSAQEAARQDSAAGRSDLALDAATAYWSLVTARESERVLAEAVVAFEQHLLDAQNRFDLGFVAKNELLAVQVEKDQAELRRLDARNDAQIANANLVSLTGLPAGTLVEPTEGLEIPAAADDGVVTALMDQALQARPELAATRSRVTALEAQARAARASARPQASLQASYDYSNPNTRILPPTATWQDTWAVGASLSLTPWDGGRTGAAVAQIQAQALALRHQLEDAERLVRLDVESRVLDLRTARAAYSVAQGNLGSAQENLRVTRDRYKEGVVASSELLDAETALLDAGLDVTRAGAGYQLNRARLDRAVGR
jgi:outer membrane protein TolC